MEEDNLRSHILTIYGEVEFIIESLNFKKDISVYPEN